MTTLDKVFITITLIGFAGCLFNIIVETDPDDFWTHTYSTIPLGAGAIILAICGVWSH